MSEDGQLKYSLLLSLYISFRLFNWLKEAHPHDGEQFAYTKFTNLDVNPPKAPSKLTHKINHDKYLYET